MEISNKPSISPVNQADTEDRYRNIIEVMRDGIIVQAANGQILECNAEAGFIFGMPVKEITARMFLKPQWEPIKENGEPFDVMQHPALVVLQTGNPVTDVVIRVTRPDRRKIWLNISSRPLFKPGQTRPYGVVSSFRDITAWKEADQNLKKERNLLATVIEGSTEAIYVKDREGRFLLANKVYLGLLGITQEEIIGHTTEELWPLQTNVLFRKTDEMVIESGQSQTYEVPITDHEGKLHIFLTTKDPYRDSQGNIIGIIGISRDITNRKRVENLKNDFIATVSHELRTPLTAIMGSLGLLNSGAAGSLPDQARQMAEVAYRNSERLLALINDILDFEKIEAGKMTYDFRPQNLRTIVEETLAINHPLSSQGKIPLILEPDNLPEQPVVMADKNRLGQVLTNLISNAIKFSPVGGEVRVRLDSVEKGFKVTVTDQGPGIPLEFRNQVFNKFAQADSSSTRRMGGTGLGLSIAKAIVENHGGEIGFTSRVGQGSAFFFEIPTFDTSKVL
jgi:PAS domain S-box-containing protein